MRVAWRSCRTARTFALGVYIRDFGYTIYLGPIVLVLGTVGVTYQVNAERCEIDRLKARIKELEKKP